MVLWAMIQKINELVESVLRALQRPYEVECVQRIPYYGGGMPSSPLFCVKLDVFYRGEIPPFPGRLEALTDISFVETSLSRQKDRFFLNKTPVHLDYKIVSEIEDELATMKRPAASFPLESSYGWFRLYHGIPVLTKSDWVRSVKAQLETLPDAFWDFQKRNLSGRLEHLLSDMAASVFNRDGLFFEISAARFLETLAELLFALNRQFVGPPEELQFQIDGLELLPTGFSGYFDTFMREDSGLDRARRVGLARHLSESVLALV